jgi:hypothetical protein
MNLDAAHYAKPAALLLHVSCRLNALALDIDFLQA